MSSEIHKKPKNYVFLGYFIINKRFYNVKLSSHEAWIMGSSPSCQTKAVPLFYDKYVVIDSLKTQEVSVNFNFYKHSTYITFNLSLPF